MLTAAFSWSVSLRTYRCVSRSCFRACRVLKLMGVVRSPVPSTRVIIYSTRPWFVMRHELSSWRQIPFLVFVWFFVYTEERPKFITKLPIKTNLVIAKFRSL